MGWYLLQVHAPDRNSDVRTRVVVGRITRNWMSRKDRGVDDEVQILLDHWVGNNFINYRGRWCIHGRKMMCFAEDC